jgi:hypothetical protein
MEFGNEQSLAVAAAILFNQTITSTSSPPTNLAVVGPTYTSPRHANKKGVMYRYRVSHALLQYRRPASGSIARASVTS